MAKAAAVAWAVLHHTSLPFVWLAQVLWAIVWNILTAIAIPFIYLGVYTYDFVSLPLLFLAKFEARASSEQETRTDVSTQTLYFYFGSALIIGLLVGALIHFIAHPLMTTLHIDKRSEQQITAWEGAEQARRDGLKQRHRLEAKTDLSSGASLLIPEYSDWPQLDKSSMKSPSTLMASTILEEDDSSASDTIEFV